MQLCIHKSGDAFNNCSIPFSHFTLLFNRTLKLFLNASLNFMGHALSTFELTY